MPLSTHKHPSGPCSGAGPSHPAHGWPSSTRTRTYTGPARRACRSFGNATGPPPGAQGSSPRLYRLTWPAPLVGPARAGGKEGSGWRSGSEPPGQTRQRRRPPHPERRPPHPGRRSACRPARRAGRRGGLHRRGRAHARGGERGSAALTFSAQVTPAIPPPTTTNRLRATPAADAIAPPAPERAGDEGKKTRSSLSERFLTAASSRGRGSRWPRPAYGAPQRPNFLCRRRTPPTGPGTAGAGERRVTHPPRPAPHQVFSGSVYGGFLFCFCFFNLEFTFSHCWGEDFAGLNAGGLWWTLSRDQREQIASSYDKN